MPSDIQVFVRFKEQSVFAGEELQSIITFRNVASISDNNSADKTRKSRGWTALGNASEWSRPGGSGGLSSQNPRLAARNSDGTRKTTTRGHGTTTSLTIPFAESSVARSASWTASPVNHSTPPHQHQRSVSIISLGLPDVGNEDRQRATFPPRSRPTLNRGRPTSSQMYPKSIRGNHDAPSSLSEPPTLQVPFTEASAVVQGLDALKNVNRADSKSANHSEFMSNSHSGSRRPSASSQDFRSPTSSAEEQPAASPNDHPALHPNHGPDDEEHDPGDLAKLLSKSELHQPTRVLAGTSITGSNRSSGDFQAPSNQSQDTLLSEQASNAPERRTFPSPMMRQHYRMGSTAKLRRNTETLLMGYAQVNGAFTLDGALVDQTPFEEVKRKGFLGGQGGGGVVGVKTLSNPAGFLGGFSLNNLGESIGGFLGGPDLSSIKEMKSVASSRTIPLLSTPQSLLFVDLTLVPGEEKSFLFRYTLPKGLPASYKGKAIKIIYNLNIGVQGAPGERPVQAVRQINIPFKVFSGVSADGEVFGHDLMQPYVILQDTADTEAVDSASSFSSSAPNGPARSSEAATQDFLTYVDTLLTKRRRRQSSSATLEAPRGLLKDDSNSRAKEAIDRAIFLSTQSTSSHQSPNRFDIARNGKRIATIVLDRTLHRLGESVTASVDLSNGQMPCYSLRCALETTEKVNPALALRSAASIARLSRRVYRLQSENTLFAERIVFTPSIPVTATPTLLTSGVNLDWALRFEFVTTRVADFTDENEEIAGKELLESVAKDDRGSILAAVETLLCETFEVSIPITVYGDTIVAAAEAEETIGLPI